ncbi:hypothetical protein ACR77J_08070 [Tissierella praeacuta]|uniref:hypothetical protein n=1 Tax=Tissierella praeacuta TaxID=43131 RepID=UPI003DA3E0DB
MNTTYDEIFQCFLENCGVDPSRLPTDEEKIYDLIKNAIRYYNAEIDILDAVGKLSYNDTLEEINVTLDDTRMMLLVYCLKYIYLENQLIEFQEIWSPYQQELGFRNYKDQVGGRERSLERVRQDILKYLFRIENKDII